MTPDQSATPETAVVGTVLPAFNRTPGFAHWNRYAAVNDEFVPIHMDDAEGIRAGYPSAIGMGRLQWSYVHVMLRQWLAGRGEITRVSLQFRRPNLRGVPIRVEATVSAVRTTARGREIDLNVQITDDSGDLLAPGSATVVLAAATGNVAPM